VLRSLSKLRFLFFDLLPRRLTRCHYLLICHDNDRDYSYRGVAYSQLLDTLREHLESHGLCVSVIATPFSILNEDKAVGSPISINGSYAIISAASSICSLFTNAKDSQTAYFQLQLWRRLLTKLQPRVVIGIQPCAALCAAGKDLQIPIYDLQHGVIGCRQDPNWYYSNRAESAFCRRGIPDKVICWDHASADVI
jgi:hypothetical protein